MESAAGVAEGGRTGWTAITVGMLFLVALFFGPLVQLVPSAATAAALILVGVFMMGAVARIDFKDMSRWGHCSLSGWHDFRFMACFGFLVDS